MKNELEFTDRYQATGRPYPKALTVCDGQCEGMGCYPVYAHDPLPSYYERYPHLRSSGPARPADDPTPYEMRAADRIRDTAGPAEDGCYFITCGVCRGTGKVSFWKGVRRLPGVLVTTVRQFWNLASGKYYKMPEVSWPQHVWLAFKCTFGGIV